MRMPPDRPLRILHVHGNLGHGGAESRVMDLYRHMDRARVQFDFAVHCDGARAPEYFDETVRELGGNIYVLPRFKVHNLAAYKKAWADLFAEHAGAWHAVQGHMTSTAAIYLPIAKKAGIPLTIAHARSAGTDPGWKGVVTRFFRRPLQKEGACDVSIACTKEAGVAVFGERLTEEKKIVILPNAIEVDQFSFDAAAGRSIRAAFQMEDAIVIGHVGRLHYAKNHDFLIRVFARMKALLEKESATYDSLRARPLKLLLVGDGDAQEIRALPARYGVAEDVVFAGDRKNVSDFYAAFDQFVFPSRYEGLPGTVIEAQASGLPCLISDRITQDVDVTPLVKRRSIDEDPALWAEQILAELSKKNSDTDEVRTTASAQAKEALQKAGFDVAAQAETLMEFYETGRFRT